MCVCMCVCVCARARACVFIYLYIITGMTVKEEDLDAIFDASGGTELSLMNTVSSIYKTLNGHDSMLHKAKGLYSQTSSIQ